MEWLVQSEQLATRRPGQEMGGEVSQCKGRAVWPRSHCSRTVLGLVSILPASLLEKQSLNQNQRYNKTPG